MKSLDRWLRKILKIKSPSDISADPGHLERMRKILMEDPEKLHEENSDDRERLK